jgi:dipeptidase E
MSGECRQIVAFGGGGFSMESGNPLLDDYVLGLASSARPRVCFLPSASGDADHYIVRFYRAFEASRCEPSHISLFRREQGTCDFRSHLLSQDVIYVGGGSLISLLGVWRAHGIDSILREAWESGVVLCGLSAGSLCWFDEAVTGFHGEPRRVEGLGLLPWSNCVHYEARGNRRESYRRFLSTGCARATAARTAARFTSRAPSSIGSSPRALRLGAGGSSGAATGSPRRGSRPPISAPSNPNPLS